MTMHLNSMLPFTESSSQERLSVNCLPVKQPIGRFFIASLPYKQLLEITYADTRRIKEEQTGFETMLGIQRLVNPNRVKEISQYVNTVDACFPTSVILSIPDRCVEYNDNEKILDIFSYPDDDPEVNVPYDKIAQVLDGQHRIEGLRDYQQDNDFEVNVTIFVDLDPASEAYIFSIVNQAQTKVNKSLVYDLYSLAKSFSPQKMCHQVAVNLNQIEESPFFNRIKRLGVAGPKTEAVAITQAAFVESLLKYISAPNKLAMQDRDLYLRNKKPSPASSSELEKMIFRNFMVEERTNDLTDIMWNYFSAIKARWPIAWHEEGKGFMLSKTSGFMAFMRFLKDIYIQEEAIGSVITEDHFSRILAGIKLKNEDFNVDNYKPGSSGEGALYRDLKESYLR